jgi:hypothetical protein
VLWVASLVAVMVAQMVVMSVGLSVDNLDHLMAEKMVEW